MSQASLYTVASQLIASYGNTAHHVIDGYRVAGERVVGFLDQRWDRALNNAPASLSAEVRSNATAAQRLLSSSYGKGIALTSRGAQAVLGSALSAADKGLQGLAANASRFEEATGVQALNQLAVVAIPAAHAVAKVAALLEQKAGHLAQRLGVAPIAATPPAAQAPQARSRKTVVAQTAPAAVAKTSRTSRARTQAVVSAADPVTTQATTQATTHTTTKARAKAQSVAAQAADTAAVSSAA